MVPYHTLWFLMVRNIWVSLWLGIFGVPQASSKFPKVPQNSFSLHEFQVFLRFFRFSLGSLTLLSILQSEGSLNLFNVSQGSLEFLWILLVFFGFLKVPQVHFRIFTLIHLQPYQAAWTVGSSVLFFQVYPSPPSLSGQNLIFTAEGEGVNQKKFLGGK